MKKVQAPDQRGPIVGQVDRKARDREFARYVVIKSGPYKGLKAKVTYADDSIVKLEVMSIDQKLALPVGDVEAIKDPTQSIGFANQHVAQMSFDEAGKMDMGDIFGLQGIKPAGQREPYKPGQMGRATSYAGDQRMTRADDADDFDPIYKDGAAVDFETA